VRFSRRRFKSSSSGLLWRVVF